MVPVHLRSGVPRRSRALLFAIICVVLIFFLPSLTNRVCLGHVFPGASLPYDTQSPAENAAGYVSDDNPILGFSHMHDSGTGGNPSLGNFPLFFHPGCPDDDFAKCDYSVMHRGTYRVPGSAFASVGYFNINLTNSVRAEMTVTEHTALYRFSPLVLVDLVDLANTRSLGGIQVYPESARVIGEGQYNPSFGSGHYQAFFCADFKGAAVRKAGTFITNNATEEPKFLDTVGANHYIPTGSAGAWIQFERPEQNFILARVGVSFISVDKACQNAEREIPDFRFERVEAEAQNAWRKQLSVIDVDATGVSEELQTTFWSGLYRSLLSPQNYTGENYLWNSTEPYFDSFYCIWDSFRAQHPLLTIIDPAAQTQMVRALLDIYKHEGKLPDCRMSFCQGYTQGGSNADIVIADAFLKNLTDGIDWDLAYKAVISDAEVEPHDWGVAGRGGLNGTGHLSRTISRGVEYAYDDFCISLMAQGLGHTADAQKYYQRGVPEHTHLLPIQNQHSCYYDTGLDTYEGSPWLYSFFAPQDTAALIGLMGGRRSLPTGPHRYIPRQFNATVNGIPGNDDGAMGAFSAFALMGFFPVAGQNVYLLTPPFFPQIRIRVPVTTIKGKKEPDKWAVIRVRNFDPEQRPFIQSATLNGKKYTNNWITHEFFLKGGVLELRVGLEESTWGTSEQDRPPSYRIWSAKRMQRD
ncbi:alpha-1,2-mannosidase-like protein [Podospora didyma]|uniref:Alpha-1,2-mannosidase-like protein n=1 Tax=Podospora didyma TaxID=330526 RepID=A0AAE0JWW2_9PEZI|nr:alpha-1,2-mannosidase-like protein [Podospora didyma]